MAIAVVSLIVGFAVYFNSPDLNKAVSSLSSPSSSTTEFIPATINKNGNASRAAVRLRRLNSKWTSPNSKRHLSLPKLQVI